MNVLQIIASTSAKRLPTLLDWQHEYREISLLTIEEMAELHFVPIWSSQRQVQSQILLAMTYKEKLFLDMRDSAKLLLVASPHCKISTNVKHQFMAHTAGRGTRVI